MNYNQAQFFYLLMILSFVSHCPSRFFSSLVCSQKSSYLYKRNVLYVLKLWQLKLIYCRIISIHLVCSRPIFLIIGFEWLGYVRFRWDEELIRMAATWMPKENSNKYFLSFPTFSFLSNFCWITTICTSNYISKNAKS